MQRSGEMRLLLDVDMKNYPPEAPEVVRPSVRGVVIRGGKVAMIHVERYGYYVFPGGGIEKGETPGEALRREMAEEAGLILLMESIRPFGRVHSVQLGMLGDKFVQDNDYYLCRAKESTSSVALEAYEAEAGYTLAFVTPREALETNRRAAEKGDDPTGEAIVSRTNFVLEALIREGYFAE